MKVTSSDPPDGRGEQKTDVPSWEAPKAGAAVTYVPKCKAFVAGEHRSVESSSAEIEAYVECDAMRRTPRVDVRGNPAHTGLMQEYLEIRRFQQKWLPLDCMFDTFGLDKPSGTMRFPTNGCGPNWGFYDIAFNLENATEKHAVFFPVVKTPPAEHALLAEREKQALASLEQLRYHYRKDGSDDAAKFARETAPTNNGTQRICDPAPDTSLINIANEIQTCRCEFRRAFGPWLNRFACSGKTAARIARKPRAARGLGPCAVHEGVYGFPGIPDSLMCVSNACDDGVLYATGGYVPPDPPVPAACPDSVLCDAPWGIGGLVKAEGLKIVLREGGQPEDYTLTDSYQYMCVHEDLPADCKFGCIIDLQSA